MAITKAFDTSRHNHPLTNEYPNGAPIDFQEAYANEYRVWMGRLAVGNYYTDAWFQPDLAAARATGFICLAYFVSTPEYSDDEQLERFLRALGGQKIDGVVLDAELSRDQTPVRVTACNQYLADRFSEMYPDRVWLYTGPSFADTYLLSDLGLPLFIANPGPGNGINLNPWPAMPKRYEDDDFIAWQKDWKHTIPGVPDPTTDYTEIQLNEVEVRAYFDMSEEEEDEMLPEIVEKLNLILDNQETIIAMLSGGTPPTPPPADPPAPKKYYVRVTAPDKTNARFVYGKNGKGKPIFQIYPGDSSKATERIQYKNGALLEVWPEKIDGDSDIDCYELVGKTAGGKQLYAWSNEVAKTW